VRSDAEQQMTLDPCVRHLVSALQNFRAVTLGYIAQQNAQAKRQGWENIVRPTPEMQAVLDALVVVEETFCAD